MIKLLCASLDNFTKEVENIQNNRKKYNSIDSTLKKLLSTIQGYFSLEKNLK
jgi:hypothetical protein